ncbi:hypothetical protein TNCV_3695921 [Trichonephila clavipes]|nr:hypothetical protein TNCV_3695921 [Trichonephila clavipes]
MSGCAFSARGRMTTTSYGTAQRWVFVTFFRRRFTPLSGRVLHANDDMPTSQCVRALVGVRHFFRRRPYSAVRSRLVHAER